MCYFSKCVAARPFDIFSVFPQSLRGLKKWFLYLLCSGAGTPEPPEGKSGGEGLRKSLPQLHLRIHFQQLSWSVQQRISDGSRKSPWDANPWNTHRLQQHLCSSLVCLLTTNGFFEALICELFSSLSCPEQGGPPRGAGTQHQKPGLLVQTHHSHCLHHWGGQELLHSLS